MKRFDRHWEHLGAVALLLSPLAVLFLLVSSMRRACYRLRLCRSRKFDVPVMVVGNITVGGAGKTPLVIWLAGHLQSLGYNPGIVSRGYGGQARNWPQQVRPDSDPTIVGDEAVLLAQRTGCPVCVGPDRPAAVAALLQHAGSDFIIADDGLQHYALARDLEIAVIDGERRLGNGLPLPAGPLRELPFRLKSVDFVIANGDAQHGEFAMKLRQPEIMPLAGGETQELAAFADLRVHAVAGIGHPQRFFDLLKRHRLIVEQHLFPDHYVFTSADLDFSDDLPVLLTEKDAIKCQRFATGRDWVVRVQAQPDAAFIHRLNLALKDLSHG